MPTRTCGFNSRWVLCSSLTTRVPTHCGVAQRYGNSLLTRRLQVRVLPPQLQSGRASQLRRWQPPRKRPSRKALRVRLPLLPLAESRATRPRPGPFARLGDRLTVGCYALNVATKVRPLLPEPWGIPRCPERYTLRGSSTAERLALNQEVSVRLRPPGLRRPGTPTGRAARLKPECLWVRPPPWVSRNGFFCGSVGNQADHSPSEGEMLWVRLPPEPL